MRGINHARMRAHTRACGHVEFSYLRLPLDRSGIVGSHSISPPCMLYISRKDGSPPSTLRKRKDGYPPTIALRLQKCRSVLRKAGFHEAACCLAASCGKLIVPWICKSKPCRHASKRSRIVPTMTLVQSKCKPMNQDLDDAPRRCRLVTHGRCFLRNPHVAFVAVAPVCRRVATRLGGATQKVNHHVQFRYHAPTGLALHSR